MDVKNQTIENARGKIQIMTALTISLSPKIKKNVYCAKITDKKDHQRRNETFSLQLTIRHHRLMKHNAQKTRTHPHNDKKHKKVKS